MANTATALAQIPAVFRIGHPQGLVKPVLVSMDTALADLEVLAAVAGKFCCLYGAFWQESAAHQLEIKSGSTVLVSLEFSGNDGLRCPLSGQPVLITKVGEALNLQLAAGSISTALFYVGYQTVLDMHG